MTRILILESNTPDMVAAGLSDAQPFVDTFPVLVSGLNLTVAEPYAAPVDADQLHNADGIVFSGSGVEWGVDDPRAAPLARAMETVFDTGLPVWGSCNGMQLAAVVLGGASGTSPNGREDGIARDIRLTDAGRAHPMMAGRTDGFGCPCVHRDEVTTLPEGATLLAGNAHSPVQAFVYDQDGVDFWGTQYHPELAAPTIAQWLRKRPGLKAMAADLDVAEDDPGAAARLGTTPAELAVQERAIELQNWIAHVRAREAPTSL